MNPAQSALAGAIVAGLAWWLLTPGDVEAPELARLQHAPADNRAGPVALLLARWSAAERFGVFPAADSGSAPPIGAGALELQGTSSSSVRRAALISIGGAKAQWIAMGEPAAGLELVELGVGRAVVRTTSGDTVTLKVFDAMDAAKPAGEANAHATN